MRVIGSRKPYTIRDTPSGSALKTGAAIQRVALALAADPTTGVRKGIYRFGSHAEANRHAEQALVRAMAANTRARKRAR